WTLCARRAEAADSQLGIRRTPEPAGDAGGHPAFRARGHAEGDRHAAGAGRAEGAAHPRRCCRDGRLLPGRHRWSSLSLAARVGARPAPRMPELPDVTVYIQALEARIA